MASRYPGWWLLPASVRALPADLTVVFVLVGLTNLVVLVPGVRETPLRILFGLPFVLFVPGYAFIAALFPEAGSEPATERTSHDDQSQPTDAAALDRGIDGIERVALSFGLSIAIVPLIGLVLNFTPWGIRLVPILVSVSGFTAVSAVVAAQRRWQLPPEERFRVPYQAWIAAARRELLEPDDRTDAVLNVLLVCSVLLAVSSVGYAVAVPKQGESFTEFYLLTRDDDDGELVAADYPTEFQAGQAKPVVIGIGNQEHEPVNYTVVVALQRVRVVNNSTRVQAMNDLDRIATPQLAHNETWHRNYSIRPTMTGTRLRLVFLLYRGPPASEPTVGNAYRELHLWINVSA